MRRVIYSFQVSLDGYINKPDGGFDELTPDDEVHRFHNEQAREIGVYLLGRRLHETMVYWDTAAEDPDLGEVGLEFAGLWKAARKLVVSNTLDSAPGDAELLDGDLAERDREAEGRGRRRHRRGRRRARRRA